MLRLSIELIPYGDNQKKRHLGTVEIANQGSGNPKRGDYKVRMIKSGMPTQSWQLGAIQDFSHQERGVYDLMLDALTAEIGPENQRVIDHLREADKRRSHHNLPNQHAYTLEDIAINDLMLDALLAKPGTDKQKSIEQVRDADRKLRDQRTQPKAPD